MTPSPARSGAHAFLEGLSALDIEYVFSNLGTDHVSIIEELARWDREGRAHPRMVLCPHENVAVHMAAGYAAVTGRGQAVMVHVDAGTANSAMGLHNMFRGRLPVMLIAGKAPFTLRGELPGSRDNYVHFVQDPFDIGSLVRPYVKWEYTLPTGRIAHAFMLLGAFAVAFVLTTLVGYVDFGSRIGRGFNRAKPQVPGLSSKPAGGKSAKGEPLLILEARDLRYASSFAELWRRPDPGGHFLAAGMLLFLFGPAVFAVAARLAAANDASRGEGEARHLSAYGRRTVAARLV